MLSRTQLIHLDNLKPTSVQEADYLLKLLENSLLFFIEKEGIDGLYNVKEVFCNRKNFDAQRDYIYCSFEDSRQINELYQVNLLIKGFLRTLADNYHGERVTALYSQLNIECCLVNKTNIALSYDLY